MKRLLALALCFIFIFASVSLAEVWKGTGKDEGWTSESHVNPFVFDKWEQISITACPQGLVDHLHGALQNWDSKHAIQIVHLVMSLPVKKDVVTILGYSYIFEGYIWAWKKNDTLKQYEFKMKIPV